MEPNQPGYYTGIGHSQKGGNNNYIQAAKKSALDDLVSDIKVNVSSSSVLSLFESNTQFTEQYEQIIKTTAADEIEEFEFVEAWEDATNYWVFYRLSIARYKEIKEEQKRNATLLATDFLKKARESENNGDQLQAITYYFQAFRSMEKYLGEAIRITLDNQEVLLVNEIYASIQRVMDSLTIRITPAELSLNRRVQQSGETLLVKATAKATGKPVLAMPLTAVFAKGSGDVFPSYKTNENGEAKILLSKISSKDIEQTLVVRLDTDLLSTTAGSPVYKLIASTFHVPHAQVIMKVQRPVVYLSAAEKSLGESKSSQQISNKLKNLLARDGFEFTDNKSLADLWFDVTADSERGSVTGSIYVTYLTSVIKVTTVREGKEIYATTLDRVKGYGLDYDKSSVDAYNKAVETLEKEKMTELINTVLQ